MAKEKHPNLIWYIITFFILLFLGNGAVWQFFNLNHAYKTLELEKQKLEFEKQKESVNLRSELNETMNMIVELNKIFEVISDKKSISSTTRREYETRYHLLIDNLERTERSIAIIEGRYEKNYNPPLPVINISPRPPKNLNILIKDEPSDAIYLFIILSFFVIYTALIILLTIYLPSMANKILNLIRKKI